MVTGKGLGSGSRGPVLKDGVPKFLHEQLGLASVPDPSTVEDLLLKLIASINGLKAASQADLCCATYLQKIRAIGPMKILQFLMLCS